jgi:hypothetical protein
MWLQKRKVYENVREHTVIVEKETKQPHLRDDGTTCDPGTDPHPQPRKGKRENVPEKAYYITPT